ncbi:MAG: mechanosensitive ion channel family protein [Candidatus Omnitrophica bacterium]|nr:mechanosensitive ion channel family protein [Candidatus Omnitrophota bacterium]
MKAELFSQPYFYNILYSFLSLIVLYGIASFMRRLINKHVQDLKRRHRIRKGIFYGAIVLLCLTFLKIWTTSLPSFITIFSFIGAGLVVALHEVVLCFAGWFLINVKRPYEVGERIEVQSIKGDVIDIGVFHTLLIEVGNWVHADQSTGRIVSIPNSVIFRNAVYNYTKEFPFIWSEIPILVTFESDWQKARDIILEAAQENTEEIQASMNSLIKSMSYRYVVHYDKLTPVVYTKIEDYGVLLTVRYLTDAKKRRTSADAISQKVLTAFKQMPNIDFAYPTTRFYQTSEERRKFFK